MTKRHRLPPKGANEASAAVSALADSRRAEILAAEEQPSAAPPESAPPPKKATTPRRTTEGMTRRTYYLTDADAEKLDSAADEIHAALKGLIPRHRILGALVTTGAENRVAIIEELRRELVDNLT